MNRTNTTGQSHFRGPFSVAVYTINIPLTVLGNTLLCWVVYKYQQLRTPNNILLASLSCANMLNVFVFVSRLIIYFYPEVESSTFCFILTLFYYSILLLTTLHLCIISVDRMLAIKYPLKYPLWVTNRRVLVIVILLWVIFIIKVSRHVHLTLDQDDFWKHMSRCQGAHKKSPKQRRFKIGIIFAYIIPFLVMSTSYGIIFKVAKAQSSKMYPETQKQAKRESELKAAKTIGLLIGAFVILYTPLYICSAIRVMNVGETLAVRRSRKKVLIYFGYLSSCASWINPIIYAFTNKEVKEHLKKLVNRVCKTSN